MKRALVCMGVVLLCAIWVNFAFGWGNATHTYFAAKLGMQRGHQDLNEMYGAVLPDAFNFVLDAKGVYLADQTHHNPLAFVRNAWRCELKAVAFGFASHNDTWGADFTAHHKGVTTPQDGWVILKGLQLAQALQPTILQILRNAGVPDEAAIPIAAGLAPEFGHDLTETAVDVLIRRNEDPQIGVRMLNAAQNRPFDVPLVLSASYAKGLAEYAHISVLAATKLIVGAESEYRKFCLQYAGIFTLDESAELETLAGVNAQIAETFINTYLAQSGVGLTVTVDPAVVYQFINEAIALAQAAPAYGPEVAATLNQVDLQLKAHQISTCMVPFALWKEGESDGPAKQNPLVYSLGQNYPNPFNPNTAINYALPEDSRVSLKVYNALGQEVATLVNDQRSAGQHRVTWDAKNFPSGVYVYRLEASPMDGGGRAAFTETKRMVLVK